MRPSGDRPDTAAARASRAPGLDAPLVAAGIPSVFVIVPVASASDIHALFPAELLARIIHGTA